jgi:ATP-dependent helicase/nuclease subunit A
MTDQPARDASLAIDRHLLLQAPAGSGKTTVLAQRFLAALASVDEPEEVLAITFTRKAAAEMRERVLLALEGTLQSVSSEQPRWAGLRAAVLAQAARRDWQLAELPARLRIQTIDSLCHEIARAMPLLGRMQQQLQVVDDVEPLLNEAAVLTLRHADAHVEYQDDADRVLRRLENDWQRACKLLAGLLPSRNRWQQVLATTPPEELGARVQASLERIATETTRAVAQALGADLLTEGERLARESAKHLGEGGEWEAQSWQQWLALVRIAIKEDGEWRASVDKRHGFPTTDRPLKQRWKTWLEDVQSVPGMLGRLRHLQDLPEPVVDDEERAALVSLSRLLLLCGSQLKLVFQQRGQVDHSEVAAVARQALTDMGTPTELSMRQTLRVRHILMDEFQDTSPDQLDLVHALIRGWDDDIERSLFLVGDPMQSIYLFRNSEVGLFLRTRAEGVGHLRLEALRLGRNFRSVPRLVEWANDAFARIFPSVEDLRSSAVTFLQAQAARSAEAGGSDALCILPQATEDPRLEAQGIAAQIASLRKDHPDWRIAVLVQKRSLAAPVLAQLARADIPALGVELASLAERPVVRDLIAIGQALQDGSDRTAWLALLHSPACGLSLRDLQALCGDDLDTPLIDILGHGSRESLDAELRRRMARITPLLLEAWNGRGRADIATATESLWRRLGGWHACRDEADRSAALQYLAALRRAAESEGVLASARLREIAERLRDAGTSVGNNPVEILTIHHSKGLEWDVVFVPGLGRGARPDQPPLLQWLELPAPGGDTDLLLAVRSLSEAGSSDALSRYISGLRRERQANERVRLLYVAVTRARHRLYLSGHARWAPKEQQWVPRSGSLLKVLWPAVREQFAALPAPDPGAETDKPDRPDLQTPWHPLPSEFTLPRLREPLRAASLSGGEHEPRPGPDYDWVGPAARAAGTLVHGELERFAATGLPDATALPARAGFFVTRLRELGIDAQQAQRLAADIVEKLQRMVRDPRAHWLFSPSQVEARSEWRLSGVVEGQLRNAVIDRSFVAEGCRWVVDFKTSTHAGAGLEQFLQSEMERYRPQLELYRTLASRAGPQAVRAALYFPWLGEFRELA